MSELSGDSAAAMEQSDHSLLDQTQQLSIDAPRRISMATQHDQPNALKSDGAQNEDTTLASTLRRSPPSSAKTMHGTRRSATPRPSSRRIVEHGAMAPSGQQTITPAPVAPLPPPPSTPPLPRPHPPPARPTSIGSSPANTTVSVTAPVPTPPTTYSTSHASPVARAMAARKGHTNVATRRARGRGDRSREAVQAAAVSSSSLASSTIPSAVNAGSLMHTLPKTDDIGVRLEVDVGRVSMKPESRQGTFLTGVGIPSEPSTHANANKRSTQSSKQNDGRTEMIIGPSVTVDAVPDATALIRTEADVDERMEIGSDHSSADGDDEHDSDLDDFASWLFDSDLPYKLQGDDSFYTPMALATRASFFGHEKIRKWIERFWRCCQRQRRRRRTATATRHKQESGYGVTDSLLDNEVLTRDEFINLQMKIGKVLDPQWSLAEAERVAMTEFDKDVGGSDNQQSAGSRKLTVIDRAGFERSLFELVDTWTSTMELDDYISFLRHLFRRITVKKRVTLPSSPTNAHGNGGDADPSSSQSSQSYREFRDLKDVQPWNVAPFFYENADRIRYKKLLLKQRQEKDHGKRTMPELSPLALEENGDDEKAGHDSLSDEEDLDPDEIESAMQSRLRAAEARRQASEQLAKYREEEAQRRNQIRQLELSQYEVSQVDRSVKIVAKMRNATRQDQDAYTYIDAEGNGTDVRRRPVSKDFLSNWELFDAIKARTEKHQPDDGESDEELPRDIILTSDSDDSTDADGLNSPASSGTEHLSSHTHSHSRRELPGDLRADDELFYGRSEESYDVFQRRASQNLPQQPRINPAITHSKSKRQSLNAEDEKSIELTPEELEAHERAAAEAEASARAQAYRRRLRHIRETEAARVPHARFPSWIGEGKGDVFPILSPHASPTAIDEDDDEQSASARADRPTDLGVQRIDNTQSGSSRSSSDGKTETQSNNQSSRPSRITGSRRRRQRMVEAYDPNNDGTAKDAERMEGSKVHNRHSQSAADRRSSKRRSDNTPATTDQMDKRATPRTAARRHSRHVSSSTAGKASDGVARQSAIDVHVKNLHMPQFASPNQSGNSLRPGDVRRQTDDLTMGSASGSGSAQHVRRGSIIVVRHRRKSSLPVTLLQQQQTNQDGKETTQQDESTTHKRTSSTMGKQADITSSNVDTLDPNSLIASVPAERRGSSFIPLAHRSRLSNDGAGATSDSKRRSSSNRDDVRTTTSKPMDAAQRAFRRSQVSGIPAHILELDRFLSRPSRRRRRRKHATTKANRRQSDHADDGDGTSKKGKTKPTEQKSGSQPPAAAVAKKDPSTAVSASPMDADVPDLLPHVSRDSDGNVVLPITRPSSRAHTDAHGEEDEEELRPGTGTIDDATQSATVDSADESDETEELDRLATKLGEVESRQAAIDAATAAAAEERRLADLAVKRAEEEAARAMGRIDLTSSPRAVDAANSDDRSQKLPFPYIRPSTSPSASSSAPTSLSQPPSSIPRPRLPPSDWPEELRDRPELVFQRQEVLEAAIARMNDPAFHKAERKRIAQLLGLDSSSSSSSASSSESDNNNEGNNSEGEGEGTPRKLRRRQRGHTRARSQFVTSEKRGKKKVIAFGRVMYTDDDRTTDAAQPTGKSPPKDTSKRPPLPRAHSDDRRGSRRASAMTSNLQKELAELLDVKDVQIDTLAKALQGEEEAEALLASMAEAKRQANDAAAVAAGAHAQDAVAAAATTEQSVPSVPVHKLSTAEKEPVTNAINMVLIEEEPEAVVEVGQLDQKSRAATPPKEALTTLKIEEQTSERIQSTILPTTEMRTPPADRPSSSSVATPGPSTTLPLPAPPAPASFSVVADEDGTDEELRSPAAISKRLSMLSEPTPPSSSRLKRQSARAYLQSLPPRERRRATLLFTKRRRASSKKSPALNRSSSLPLSNEHTDGSATSDHPSARSSTRSRSPIHRPRSSTLESHGTRDGAGLAHHEDENITVHTDDAKRQTQQTALSPDSSEAAVPLAGAPTPLPAQVRSSVEGGVHSPVAGPMHWSRQLDEWSPYTRVRLQRGGISEAEIQAAATIALAIRAQHPRQQETKQVSNELSIHAPIVADAISERQAWLIRQMQEGAVLRGERNQQQEQQCASSANQEVVVAMMNKPAEMSSTASSHHAVPHSPVSAATPPQPHASLMAQTSVADQEQQPLSPQPADDHVHTPAWEQHQDEQRVIESEPSSTSAPRPREPKQIQETTLVSVEHSCVSQCDELDFDAPLLLPSELASLPPVVPAPFELDPIPTTRPPSQEVKTRPSSHHDASFHTPQPLPTPSPTTRQKVRSLLYQIRQAMTKQLQQLSRRHAAMEDRKKRWKVEREKRLARLKPKRKRSGREADGTESMRSGDEYGSMMPQPKQSVPGVATFGAIPSVDNGRRYARSTLAPPASRFFSSSASASDTEGGYSSGGRCFQGIQRGFTRRSHAAAVANARRMRTMHMKDDHEQMHDGGKNTETVERERNKASHQPSVTDEKEQTINDANESPHSHGTFPNRSRSTMPRDDRHVPQESRPSSSLAMRNLSAWGIGRKAPFVERTDDDADDEESETDSPFPALLVKPLSLPGHRHGLAHRADPTVVESLPPEHVPYRYRVRSTSIRRRIQPRRPRSSRPCHSDDNGSMSESPEHKVPTDPRSGRRLQTYIDENQDEWKEQPSASRSETETEYDTDYDHSQSGAHPSARTSGGATTFPSFYLVSASYSRGFRQKLAHDRRKYAHRSERWERQGTSRENGLSPADSNSATIDEFRRRMHKRYEDILEARSRARTEQQQSLIAANEETSLWKYKLASADISEERTEEYKEQMELPRAGLWFEQEEKFEARYNEHHGLLRNPKGLGMYHYHHHARPLRPLLHGASLALLHRPSMFLASLDDLRIEGTSSLPPIRGHRLLPPIRTSHHQSETTTTMKMLMEAQVEGHVATGARMHSETDEDADTTFVTALPTSKNEDHETGEKASGFLIPVGSEEIMHAALNSTGATSLQPAPISTSRSASLNSPLSRRSSRRRSPRRPIHGPSLSIPVDPPPNTIAAALASQTDDAKLNKGTFARAGAARSPVSPAPDETKDSTQRAISPSRLPAPLTALLNRLGTLPPLPTAGTSAHSAQAQASPPVSSVSVPPSATRAVNSALCGVLVSPRFIMRSHRGQSHASQRLRYGQKSDSWKEERKESLEQCARKPMPSLPSHTKHATWAHKVTASSHVSYPSGSMSARAHHPSATWFPATARRIVRIEPGALRVAESFAPLPPANAALQLLPPQLRMPAGRRQGNNR